MIVKNNNRVIKGNHFKGYHVDRTLVCIGNHTFAGLSPHFSLPLSLLSFYLSFPARRLALIKQIPQFNKAVILGAKISFRGLGRERAMEMGESGKGWGKIAEGWEKIAEGWEENF